jgi:tetratricopeptide (TPR) repeat protein
VLRELALVLREQGDFAGATALFEEGLALHHAIGDRVSEAFDLLGLADIARDQGESVGVRGYCAPSLAILRESGMQWAIGFALNTLALGTYYEGNLTQASALIRESVALFRNLKADGSLAEVLITLGKIMHAQGDAAAAYGAITEALRLAQGVGPRLFVAASIEGLASVVAERGQGDLTVRLLSAASALRVQMGAPVWPADQGMVDHALATARSMISADTFAAVWAEAQSLPAEQILNGIPSVAVFTAVRDLSET